MRRLLLLVLLLVLPTAPARAEARPGFRWPVAGTPSVTRGFEPPHTRYGVGHRGVDLASSLGAAVLAAGPGRITYAGVLAGRGVVTVAHDGGLRTTYEPVAARVHVGQRVAAGDVLGTLSGGHASCRPGSTCLHWGLLRGQTYLDPLSLLRPTDVRLLPVDGAAVGTGSADRAILAPAPVATRASDVHSRAGRSLGGVAAVTALVAGVGLILRRPAPPSPPPGGTLVDLRLERRRRRAA